MTPTRFRRALAGLLLLGSWWSAQGRPLSHAVEEEQLIGWQGDSYKPQAPGHTWMQQVSWKPRAYVIHNLITTTEAQHIVDLSWPRMRRSTVVGTHGESVLDDYRTSYGTFISRYETPVVKTIQDRVSLLTHLRVINQEDMQVLRYGVGQYYHKHMDSLDDDSPRVATLLIYLNTPEEGGETSFPYLSEWSSSKLQNLYDPEFSQCAKGHVAFKPKRGDALLFFSIAPDGRTEDPRSMHEGCPIIKGAKWTTTIWIHPVPFRPQEFQNTTENRNEYVHIDPGVCKDMEERCKEWAAAGECSKNPGFMKGSADQPGACLSSCKACEPCTEKDKQARAPCYWANRKRQNFLVFDPTELLFDRD